MDIIAFNPLNVSETQYLTEKFCMPMDGKKFIKWRGKFKRKGCPSINIETDTCRYINQVQDFYKAKNNRGFTLDDIAVICQLRYIGARSSLKNAYKSKDRLRDFSLVTNSLRQIMAECDRLYIKVKKQIEKRDEEKFYRDLGYIFEE